MEQAQAALSLRIKKAEKEHSWKAGLKAHLEQFAETDEEKEQLEKTKQELIVRSIASDLMYLLVAFLFIYFIFIC